MKRLTVHESWETYWKVQDEPSRPLAPSFKLEGNNWDELEALWLPLSVNLLFEEATQACPVYLARGPEGFALYQSIWKRQHALADGTP